MSERAALVYLLTLPHADVAGALEADALGLRLLCGRFAATHGWDDADLEKATSELMEVGLWSRIDGHEAIRITGWEEHQNLRGSREAPSRFLSTPGAPKGVRTDDDIEAEKSRIRTAWCLAQEDGLKRAARPLRPADLQAVREAAELGTCLPYKGGVLAREMVTQIRGLESKGLSSGLKAVINNLGNKWEGPIQKPKFTDDAQAEAAKEATRKLREEMESIGRGGRKKK